MKTSHANKEKIKDISKDVPLTVFIAEPSTKRPMTKPRVEDTPNDLAERQAYLDRISGRQKPN